MQVWHWFSWVMTFIGIGALCVGFYNKGHRQGFYDALNQIADRLRKDLSNGANSK